MARSCKPICFSVTPIEDSKLLYLTNQLSLEVGASVPVSRILNTLIWIAISDSETYTKLFTSILSQLHPQDPETDPKEEA